jgi:hypothetical protein
MQIIFDSRYDGTREATVMRDMLDVYVGRMPAAAVPGNTLPAGATLDAAQGIVTLPPAAQRAAPLAPPPPGAPSDAAAAQSPTAPAASTVGAPPPPPASPPSAPQATASTAPAAPTNPVVVDVTGLPWDERIHAANKATIANGQWRKRRGLNDEAYINSVVAELRAKHPVTATVAPAPTAPPPPPAGGLTLPEVAAAFNVPVTMVAPPPPPPPAAPSEPAASAAPPPPPAPAEPTLMEWLGDAMGKGKVQFPAVTEEVIKLGAKQLSDFASNPAFIPMAPVLLAALKARHGLQ